MDCLKVVFLVIFTIYAVVQPLPATELKTVNISMPTNYGVFLAEIHYKLEDRAVAMRVERIIKEDLIKVINYFEYSPKDVVHFNIDPYMRLTNGNARPFPTNIINLYNFPASQKDHLISLENWMQGLVLHEFVHITHMDQTRDYLQTGRNIFGTVAKLPASITPRWFMEGVATWGESHLLNGGRLNNDLFNKELYLFYKNPKNCQRLDCLDAPSGYPNGQLAYWAGAHFLEYLEAKKAKTIKCLVEINSSSIPFYLNRAFESCTDEKAQNLYAKFKSDFIAKFEQSQNSPGEWGEKLKNINGADEFQKGLVLVGDRLIKAEKEGSSEALACYDLKSRERLKKSFDAPIVDIVAADNENILVSFADDPHYRRHNRNWKLINLKTLTEEKKLTLAIDASYVFQLGKDHFLSIGYLHNQWVVYKDQDLVHSFSSDLNLVMIKKIDDQILLKLNDSFGMNYLLKTDLDFKKINVVYKSAKYFEIPSISKNQWLIRENNQTLKLIQWGSSPSISDLPAEQFKYLTFLEYNDQLLVALGNDLTFKESKMEETEKVFSKLKTKSEPLLLTEFQEASAVGGSFTFQSEENYPRLDHYLPHFWFLATGNSENLVSIGAMTTLVDPMDVTSLNLIGLVYPTEGKVGGTIDFRQKVISVSDLWEVSAYFNQDYAKSDFTNQVNLSRDLIMKSSYRFLKQKWTMTPTVFTGLSINQDFLSKRTVNTLGVATQANYQSLSSNEFWQSFSSTLSVQGNSPDNGKSFLALESRVGAEFNLFDKLGLTTKLGFGKLFKSDYRRGALFGGGVSDFARARFFEFYGIPYGNIYGNQILSTQSTLDYNLWSVYRGKNFIPLYLKEVHLLMGFETIYADRIFLDEQILRNQVLHGYYMGPRAKMNLFYYVPANLDLIFSSIAHPNGKNVQQVEALLTVDLF